MLRKSQKMKIPLKYWMVIAKEVIKRFVEIVDHGVKKEYICKLCGKTIITKNEYLRLRERYVGNVGTIPASVVRGIVWRHFKEVHSEELTKLINELYRDWGLTS